MAAQLRHLDPSTAFDVSRLFIEDFDSTGDPIGVNTQLPAHKKVVTKTYS
jgi:hypothetical protein